MFQHVLLWAHSFHARMIAWRGADCTVAAAPTGANHGD